MSRFTSLSRGELVEAIDTSSSTPIKVKFEEPFQKPADPAGRRARLVLIDDVRRPTSIEVVAFTGYSEFNDALTLEGVERGIDGTAAASFSAGAGVGMDLPATILEFLLGDGSQGESLMVGEGGLLSYSSIGLRELKNIIGTDAHILLEAQSSAPSVPAGEAVVYLDQSTGNLLAKFDDGTTATIA